MKPKDNSSKPGERVTTLKDAGHFSLVLSQDADAALRAMPLAGSLIFWPVVLMCFLGFRHFIELISQTIGDMLVTRALYPAKMVIFIVGAIYLIWALREIWFALGRYLAAVAKERSANP